MVEKAKRKAAALVVQGAQTKKRRRFKGMLEDISEMPMEIFYEILSHLHPADLLSLSRTTKPLRSLLMSKESGELVWKTCRKNVPGFPDCPADLSKPQYAELAFGKACFKCGKNDSDDIIAWHARTRLCGKCFQQDYYNPANGRPATHDVFSDFLPRAAIDKGNCWFFERHTSDLWVTERMTLGRMGRVLWLQRILAERVPIIQHAEACLAWEISTFQAGFEQQLLEVKARVVELDYRREFDRLHINPYTGEQLPYPVGDHRILRMCWKEFGPEAWEKIDSIINEQISARFSLRFERACDSALDHLAEIRNGFVMTLPVPQTPPYIPLIDLVFSPGYSEIFDKYISDEMEEPQDGKALEISPEQFLEYHANWVKTGTKRLVETIRQAFDSASLAQDQMTGIDLEDHEQCAALLERPAILFRCTECFEALHYPDALVHDCAYAVEDDMPLTQVVRSLKGNRLPWKCRDVIVFDPRDFFAANNFVKFCGLSTQPMEIQDLDQLVFACKLCTPGENVPPLESVILLGSGALYHCLGRGWVPAAAGAHEELMEQYSTPSFNISDFSTVFRPFENDSDRSQIIEMLGQRMPNH